MSKGSEEHAISAAFAYITKMVLTDFPFFKVPFFSDVAHKSATNKGPARQLQSIQSSIKKELGSDSAGDTGTK